MSDDSITARPEAYEVLRDVFGYETFRPGQETVVEAVLDGTRDHLPADDRRALPLGPEVDVAVHVDRGGVDHPAGRGRVELDHLALGRDAVPDEALGRSVAGADEREEAVGAQAPWIRDARTPRPWWVAT